MWINVPDEQVIETENLFVNLETFSDIAIKSLLAKYSQLFAAARRIEAERKELEKYSRPKVPMDVPEPVWHAVANLYPDQTDYGWTPAPNHHVEYRDCRAAYIAALRLWAARFNEQIAGYIDRNFTFVPNEPVGD